MIETRERGQDEAAEVIPLGQFCPECGQSLAWPTQLHTPSPRAFPWQAGLPLVVGLALVALHLPPAWEGYQMLGGIGPLVQSVTELTALRFADPLLIRSLQPFFDQYSTGHATPAFADPLVLDTIFLGPAILQYHLLRAAIGALMVSSAIGTVSRWYWFSGDTQHGDRDGGPEIRRLIAPGVVRLWAVGEAFCIWAARAYGVIFLYLLLRSLVGGRSFSLDLIDGCARLALGFGFLGTGSSL
jgi:hypothetical protein